MDNQDNELLQSFIEESREHLADIESDLLLIEQQGPNIEEHLINKVFRAAHSIKGGAGFLGLEVIKDLSHNIETVLGMIRARSLVPNPDVINILLRCFDRLRDLINDVANSNNQDISEYIDALRSIASAEPKAETPQVKTLVQLTLPSGYTCFSLPKEQIQQAFDVYKWLYILQLDLIQDLHPRWIMPLDLLDELDKKAHLIDVNIQTDLVGQINKDSIIAQLPLYVLFASEDGPENIHQLIGLPCQELYQVTRGFDLVPVSQPALQPRPRQEGHQARPQVTSEQHHAGQTTLRVNVKLLDNLMNLAGELVLSRNELVQAASNARQDMVNSATQRINLVTSQLQEAIMRTRMQPVGNLFGKFPRVVRDLARQLGKQIELSIEGSEVELDKTIIEGLADPLTHLIRNAADHGIELPEVRRASGKQAVGRIWLRAYHEAGQVNIEIADDGKGIDPDRVAKTAVQKGFVSAQQVQAMSEKDKLQLIFIAGLSAAEKVTDVSGRGVGMDVVKTNLERLGGQIDIDTRVGKGTTVRLKLPLTLAIIPSLMISCGRNRYALPMVNVVELLRIAPNQANERLARIGQIQVLRLRHELLPLVSLAQILGLEDQQADPARALNIVVVLAGSLKYGLIVDGLYDSEEIVVKPLNGLLKRVGAYAGATILGDGQVALILDAAGLAQLAGLNDQKLAGSNAGQQDSSLQAASTQPSQSLLVFSSSQTERFGVPVDVVDRIERIRISDLKTVTGKKVIHYRDGILPVYTIDQVIKAGPLEGHDELLVIVFQASASRLGILATGPIDSLQVEGQMDRQTLCQPGVAGSLIINGQTTLVLDIDHFASVLGPSGHERSDSASQPAKILYAEDSDFFRATVRNLLEQAGYSVVEAVDGLDAWRILQDQGHQISLVLTDIEMPNLDGVGLAKRIRSDPGLRDIPVMALTTLASDLDVEKGKAAGLCAYQIKLDKDNLLAAISQIIGKDSL